MRRWPCLCARARDGTNYLLANAFIATASVQPVQIFTRLMTQAKPARAESIRIALAILASEATP